MFKQKININKTKWKSAIINILDNLEKKRLQVLTIFKYL